MAAKRKRKGKKRARGDGRDADVPVLRVRVPRPHVAQEYLETHRADVAWELVRGLKPWARRAVVGNIRQPEVSR